MHIPVRIAIVHNPGTQASMDQDTSQFVLGANKKPRPEAHDAGVGLELPTADATACTTPALGENGVDPGFKSDLTAAEDALCECARLREGSNGGARLDSVDPPGVLAPAFTTGVALPAGVVDADAEDELEEACWRKFRGAWWFAPWV